MTEVSKVPFFTVFVTWNRKQHWREELVKRRRTEKQKGVKIIDSIAPYIALPKIKWEVSDWFVSARLNTPLSSNCQGLDRHQVLTEAPPISYETEITMSIEKEVTEIAPKSVILGYQISITHL